MSTLYIKTIHYFTINTDMDNVYLKATNPVKGVAEPLRFQYTPQIEYGQDVKYDAYNLVHTNYQPYAYARSEPPSISIMAKFSSHTTEHFKQSEYALRFLRTYTKMNYGKLDGAKGQPPRILRFFAYGSQVFENVPVVISKFSVTFPEDVDYIYGVFDTKGNLGSTAPAGRNPGNATNRVAAEDEVVITAQRIQSLPMYLPSLFQISITLNVQINTYKTSNEFSLDDFGRGALSGDGYI
jgi:hypothetical protein